jgi:hypothetical protein
MQKNRVSAFGQEEHTEKWICESRKEEEQLVFDNDRV